MKHATFAMCGYGPMLTNGKAILGQPVEYNCEKQLIKYQRKKKKHCWEFAEEMTAKYENKQPDKTVIRALNVLKILETSTSI